MAYGASAQAWDTKRSVGEMVSLPMVVDKIYKGTILDIDANDMRYRLLILTH